MGGEGIAITRVCHLVQAGSPLLLTLFTLPAALNVRANAVVDDQGNHKVGGHCHHETINKTIVTSDVRRRRRAVAVSLSRRVAESQSRRVAESQSRRVAESQSRRVAESQSRRAESQYVADRRVADAGARHGAESRVVDDKVVADATTASRGRSQHDTSASEDEATRWRWQGELVASRGP